MYKVTLAIRYLLKRRIAYFAVLAVALCVFIVVVVMTVMTGRVSGFKQKNYNITGDCVIGTESLVGFAYYEDLVETLDNADFVEGLSPVIKSYGLINRMGSERDGVEIMGIDPVRHSRATGFGNTLCYHNDEPSRAFEPAYDPNLPGCIMGSDLDLKPDADSRYGPQVSPERMGYSVSCFPLTAKGAPAQAGTGMVNTKTFYYSDYSESGVPRVDGAVVYLPFEPAQQLCGMSGPVKRANAIHIKFKPGVRLEDGCEKVASIWQSFKQAKSDEPQAYLLDTVRVQSWKDYRRESIAPMEKEQTVMIVMFAFVAVVVVFIVFVVFYMVISHKSKDIGILKSIGVSSLNVAGLFSGFAFLVGLLGSCIGTFAALLFLRNMNRIEGWLFDHFSWQLFDRTIYAIGDIPSHAEPGMLAIIALSAIVACLAGALVPSWQAARQNPAETLQVNQL
ncbi:MAG: FtsX-like permease family protein [Planctomycetota bacterium]